MTKKNTKNTKDVDFSQVAQNIEKVQLGTYLEKTFLVYAYETIYSRSLFSAEDGMKPVGRRILWSMHTHGYTPNKSHVKSARIVGEVMSNFHPHGDSSIYDAMVRLAQPFSLRVPLVDGHGNFGFTPGDPAAAARYSEARLSEASTLLLRDIRESTVDMLPNYDGTHQEPVILPSMFPNLLINGGFGIATGVACNLPPHNPDEIMDAAKYLLSHPNASTEKLMTFVPGPDLPTGGIIIGTDGIKEAYETGKGRFRIRGAYHVEPLNRGKHNIVFTEIPYGIPVEKIIDEIKGQIDGGKLTGVADVKDLTDRRTGTRFVVETKAGTNPQTLTEELYNLTSLEITFGINNTVLIAGEPQVAGLKTLLEVFLNHRINVVTRRSQHQKLKKEERLHLVNALTQALINIDKVIKIVRGSDNINDAKNSLTKTLKIDDNQAEYILSLQLRRLTRLDQLELDQERETLQNDINELAKILGDINEVKKIVGKEITEAKKVISNPRKTVIQDTDLATHVANVKATLSQTSAPTPSGEPQEDNPATLWLYADGKLAKTSADSPAPQTRGKHNPILTKIETTNLGQAVLVTNRGNAYRINMVEAHPDIIFDTTQFGIKLPINEKLVALSKNVNDTEAGLALATRQGVVKIVNAQDYPIRADEFTVITLNEGDEIVAGEWVGDAENTLFAFISTDTSLLATEANKIRPQGRGGGGVAGMKLGENQHVIAFRAINKDLLENTQVFTHTGTNAKTSLLSEYPTKGRGTGGVRSQSLLKSETGIVYAGIGVDLKLADKSHKRVALPPLANRRDAAGKPSPLPVFAGE